MDDIKNLPGQFLTVPEAAQELREGHFVLLCDDNYKENGAVLCLAAQFATVEAIDFLTHFMRDSLRVALTGERFDSLLIAQETQRALSSDRTSPARAQDSGEKKTFSQHALVDTIHALIDSTITLEMRQDLSSLSLLRAHPGGLLAQRGHAEAAIDLLRIAGLEPVALLCELFAADDRPLAGQDLLRRANSWHTGIISSTSLIGYHKENRVSFITKTTLPTAEALFQLHHFQEIATGKPYLALILGDLHTSLPSPLVRLHSACATGDIFGSQRCDCQAQLHRSLHQIAQEGRGLLLYLPQEGRGIGLAGKLQAYALQEQGYDTLEANQYLGYPIDARDYTVAIEILCKLGVTQVRLLTNNPVKAQALSASGIMTERVPLEIPPSSHNEQYLQTKQQRLGHMLRFFSS